MRKIGVMVISHGSHSIKWVRLVDEAVADAPVPAGVPVVSCFLEIVEGRLIQDGILALENSGVTDIVAVPLFVSSGSTHIDEIGYALGVIPEPTLPTKLVPLKRKAAIHFTGPIDDDPHIARIVYDKVLCLSRNPSKEIVLLTGHGSSKEGFRQRWKAGLDHLAARLRELGGFGEADSAILLPDELSYKVELWQKRKPDYEIIVAPLFLSEGYFTRKVIPSRLQGRGCRYNGKAMLPHPLLSRWIGDQVAHGLTGEKAISFWDNG